MKVVFKNLIRYYLLMYALTIQAQIKSDYALNVKLNTASHQLIIEQDITLQNKGDFPLRTIYLNDWANAYSSTKSALANRLVEEYNRSFYLSSKSKRGFTSIQHIRSNDTILSWNRPENHIDRIEIVLNKPLLKEQVQTLKINYTVTLPDAKFTGYGILRENNYFLENFFLTTGWHKDNQWNLISNLDLEDHPNAEGNFTIDFETPKGINVFSNLDHLAISEKGTTTKNRFSGKKVTQILFHLGDSVSYASFKIGESKTIYSNFETEGLSKLKQDQSLEKIFTFLTKEIGNYPHASYLLSNRKYQKRPFSGFTLIPSFLKPYLPEFEFELKTLNTFLHHYLNEHFSFHPREDFWFAGGLHSYFMMKYVKMHYPEERLLGLLMRQPLARFFLKKYQIGQTTFNATFTHFHEFMLRRNLQQEVFASKEELIRFNEQIGNPSQMGSLLQYLDHNKQIDIDSLLNKLHKSPSNGKDLKAAFLAQLNPDSESTISNYLSKRQSVDFYFSSINTHLDSVNFVVDEKNTQRFPYSIGWVRNDSLIGVEKFKGATIGQSFRRKLNDVDYLVINPEVKLAEFNPRNNYKKVSGNGKPLRLTFVKDLENPKHKQLFYNPRVNFNAYDGLTLGLRLNNMTVQRNPFTFNIEPFYALEEKTFVGAYAASFTKFNENSQFFAKNIGLSGSSFHYDESLRYNIFRASVNVFKRSRNLRNNRKEAFRLFWQYVHREQNLQTDKNPNYSLGGIRYVFSNKGALNHLTFVNQLEISEKFGKIDLTADYRHLLPSGRQFSIRLFAGKFLYRNNLNTSYFDYALDRPTDYLFRYNYLGRSETSGFYSQQYIAAEGGFKSKFENPFVNDHIVSINTSMGLWKWFEIYGDLGWMKSKNSNSRTLFDLGLRLNILPDYLELFFPCFNSNGFQLDKASYNQQIRFVFTIDPKTLNQLFTRKWF